MRKGEATKERIVEQTAPLFNRMGFFGSSLSDIMRVTGLKKGGIYNHFESKEDLALQAFDYAASRVFEKIARLLEGKEAATDRLLAFAAGFRDNYENPPIPGGCPILNTAVESDDAHPALRERAVRALDRWRGHIRGAVEDGIRTGELRPDVDPDVVASRLVATLEGGLMLSRLYQDPIHIRRATEFIAEYVQGLRP